ncbi:hypothetical protein [Amycolatopsis sp. WAC 04182]|uniref:hypothetical protein n=1 Tax=Amycolatopsis sp. WAC 04182 TaxID=2203198 RepID=UPI000F79B1E5|nr:hypothetical protein [Amycolatopsis sp. WAC 04182]
MVIRLYGGDGRRHAYLAIDLAGEGYYQVHPVCIQVFGYRLAHVVGIVGSSSFAGLGNSFEACELCASWLRSQPHEVLVGSEIVAVRGTLDFSGDQLRRGRPCPESEASAVLAA